MTIKNSLSLLFRKYSVFRVFSYLVLIAIALTVISIATVKSKKIPVIDSVIPVVGSPGDEMIIRGSNFGDSRETNFVEIGGNRITASGYITWSDNFIKIILPSNVQDGLVIVSTQAGNSKPGFFANQAGIPVALPPETKTSLPVITGINPSSGGYGSLVTISGSDFGTVRGESKVYFTSNAEVSHSVKGQGEVPNDFDFSIIAASESDFDYEYWSDSEIRVRIPDGAASGNIFVETDKGRSNPISTEIKLTAGTKEYEDQKTYILQVNADIDSLDSKNGTNITLRFPRPVVLSWQPMVSLIDCNPDPMISDYKNTVIHQVTLKRASNQNRQNKKLKFSQNFAVSTYAVHTQINPKAVRPFSNKKRILYKNSVEADQLIKSSDEKVLELVKEIAGKETNPYNLAKLAYSYMIQNYTIQHELRKGESSPLDLLKKKRGDAYDFAILYTTLLRAMGIPANPLAGILVDSELKSKSHWWTEFYIEGFGWVPVDIALAKGLPYNSFKSVENPEEYYFGNIDGQHIAFSKGWNEIKQTISQNSKIVYRPRSYALQSIWEESSEGNVNYSSLWNDPVITGLY